MFTENIMRERIKVLVTHFEALMLELMVPAPQAHHHAYYLEDLEPTVENLAQAFASAMSAEQEVRNFSPTTDPNEPVYYIALSYRALLKLIATNLALKLAPHYPDFPLKDIGEDIEEDYSVAKMALDALQGMVVDKEIVSRHQEVVH